MMPEVSICYLIAIFRVFLLIIGQKQSFSEIASTKSRIDLKCRDSLKPLYVGGFQKGQNIYYVIYEWSLIQTL